MEKNLNFLDRNEFNYSPSKEVVEALKNFDINKLCFYTRIYDEGKKSILSVFLSELYDIDETQVLLGYGGEDILKQAVHYFLTQEDGNKTMLIPKFSWWYYKSIADEVNGHTLQYPLYEDGNTFKYDFTGLLMHAEHLEAVFGVGPHTISVPRICPADDIDTADFPNAVSDDIFRRIVAVIRIAVPYTGMIISTRESQESRQQVLDIGISQISGGSRTSVGGYAVPEPLSENSAQFDLNDTRTLDEIVSWLLDLGYIPSFCTACYRAGRTGDRFMSLVKSGQIANCCGPNALMTLKEYLEDYASPATRIKGESLIAAEAAGIPNPKIKEIAIRNLSEIANGKRDFRF